MIDFNKRLTDKQKENIRKRKEDENKRTIDIIYAEDEKGNKFKKTVILSKDYKIISFGWPCEYYLNDLIKNIFSHINKNNKINKFIIDAMGKNHKGYEISIPINKTIEILKKAVQLRKKLINKDKINV